MSKRLNEFQRRIFGCGSNRDARMKQLSCHSDARDKGKNLSPRGLTTTIAMPLKAFWPFRLVIGRDPLKVVAVV